MLHELLLALSGHPSPLFDEHVLEEFPAISPAERGLIKSAGHLASLHRALKKHLARIISDHQSLICRAVAQSVVSTHLSRFQQLILEKEREILRKDATAVGAYDIVPLAGVLKSFDGWKRRLEWYWELASLILPVEARHPKGKDAIAYTPCSGTFLMKSLRLSANTGYPDIEAAAISLQQIAECVWMRHLSTWILTGQLLDHGVSDFFINSAETQMVGIPEFRVDHELVPPFVDEENVSAILFIGKLLNFLKLQNTKPGATASSMGLSPRKTVGGLHTSPSAPFNAEHMRLLSAIEVPIKTAVLTATISDIRRSLSNKLVDELLPTHDLVRILETLKDLFLLRRIDFADNLVLEAGKYLQARHQQIKLGKQRLHGPTDLAGVMMKQGELDTVLSRTWSATLQWLGDDEIVDEDFDWAQDHLRLKLASNLTPVDMHGRRTTVDTTKALVRSGVGSFNDFLLSTPAMLTLELESSLSFFLSPPDLRIYSLMHTYLLAIRRGQQRIGTLWKKDKLRKQTPMRHFLSKTQDNSFTDDVNERTNMMTVSMRKMWACSSAAYIVLSELGAYFAEEVVANSWDRFHSWATNSRQRQRSNIPSSNKRSLGTETYLNQSTSSHASSLLGSIGLNSHNDDAEDTQVQLRDIEDLIKAHQYYLSSLTTALLLHDEAYVRTLRSVLSLVDQLVAFVDRLQQAQHNLDSHITGADEGAHNRLAGEGDYLRTEVAKAAQGLDEALQHLKGRLSGLATARKWSKGLMRGEAEAAFEPWESGGSLERLLTKLEFSVPMNHEVA